MKRARQFLQAAGQQFSTMVHRCVSLLERERRAQLTVVVAVSLVIAAVVTESVMSTRHERRRWTSEVSVVVLTASVRAGERLGVANTTTVSVPRALLADDALLTLPPRTHARIALGANTALTSSLTIPAAEAVVIPVGWRVIALPPDITTPQLTPGDRVDIIIGDTVITTDSIVVSIAPFTLALPAEVIPSVTVATRVGDVFIAAQK